MTIKHPELTKLAERIRTRDDEQRADRARQRVIMRELVAQGHTWDSVQSAAQVTRKTLSRALHEPDA